MERRSERLANLDPVSYRETGVKRVFKKIRRRRMAVAIQEEQEWRTWEESCLQREWGSQSSEFQDLMQPCCSKDLLDQRHLFVQPYFETPMLMEANPNILIAQNQQSPDLVEPSRPVTEKLIFWTLIFVLGVFSGSFFKGFHGCWRFPSHIYKQQRMEIELSRQNDALLQQLQKQVRDYRKEVAELQNLRDAFEPVMGIQKHRFTKGGPGALSRYIPKKGFTLQSAGASVVKSSKSFTTGAQICIWGICWDYSRSPDVILEPDNSPGNCWAMDGSQGYVVIKLTQAISPAAVTLDHTTQRDAHNEEISSAPKYFSVYGLKDDFEKQEGTFLGTFVYKIDGFSMQTFTLQKENSERFQYLRLRILDNWGHPNYTCIYGFRVHGE